MTLADQLHENEERRRRWVALVEEARAIADAGRHDEAMEMLERLEAEVDEVLRGLGIDPATVKPS